MPPVLLPSTLLPSNICRFAVNNAKFASLEIFTLSNPRKVEETDLSVSLSLFLSFVIQRRGSRVITSHLLKGLLFHLFTSHAPLEGLSWYFLVIAASPRNLAKLPPIPFSWNFSWTYCTLGMEYWLEGGAISPMTTLENYRREVDGWNLDRVDVCYLLFALLLLFVTPFIGG